jgi:ATP-binding cassette subfamily C protein/subfamily B ATP-binding cassette protein MsbA
MENLRWLIKQLLPYSPLILLSFIGSLFQSAGASAVTLLVKRVVDDVFIFKDYESLVKTVLMMLGSAVLMQAGFFTAKYSIIFASENTLLKIREGIFSKLLKVPYTFFIRHPTGDLISRVVSDVEKTKIILTENIPNLMINSVVFLGLLGVLFYRDYLLTFILVFALPVMALMVKFFGRKKGKHTKRTQEGMADLTQILSQTLQGVENIKVFSAENRVIKAFREFNRKIFRSSVKSEFYLTANTALNYTFGYFVVSVVFFYGGYRIIKGELTPGEFISYLTALFLIQPPLLAVQKSLMALKGNLPIVSRISSLLNLEEEQHGKLPFKGFRASLSFRNVSVRIEDKEILKEINLEIKKGEKIGIVGHTGSGKSTLVKIIPRLVDYGGSVRIDGVELKEYEVSSLRSAIGMSTQENFLINATIKENILIAKPTASEREIIRALELAGCDFVWNLERGIETPVGERGYALSGGERQRLALARVFLKSPQIVILDEATSALDLNTEKRIIKNIYDHFADKTVIFVAHRISNVMDCDRIIVMREGTIVEEGTFYSLIERRGEFYRIFQEGGVV